MNASRIAAGIGGIVLIGLGFATAVANPSPRDYENFAAEHLTTYLKENACKKLPKELGDFGLQWCRTLGDTVIDTGRPQLKQIIANKTRRSNFIFFSIYQTTFSLGSLSPTYEFETLAVLQQFYTYRAEEL